MQRGTKRRPEQVRVVPAETLEVYGRLPELNQYVKREYRKGWTL